MKIQKIINTTKEEIESKKFNIYIGISLGNKWFTKENLQRYMDWSLENTKEKVLFLIADKIQAINYNVRNKSDSQNTNLKRAIRKGNEMKIVLEELKSNLPKEKQKNVIILYWQEYEEQSEFYKKYTPKIYSEFENNKEFRKGILDLVKSLIRDRKFSEEEYLKFSEYFLEEFIDLFSGVKIGNNYYGLYLYPQNSSVFSFMKKIQEGKSYPELNKKLPKEKVALAVIN